MLLFCLTYVVLLNGRDFRYGVREMAGGLGGVHAMGSCVTVCMPASSRHELDTRSPFFAFLRSLTSGEYEAVALPCCEGHC